MEDASGLAIGVGIFVAVLTAVILALGVVCGILALVVNEGSVGSIQQAIFWLV